MSKTKTRSERIKDLWKSFKEHVYIHIVLILFSGMCIWTFFLTIEEMSTHEYQWDYEGFKKLFDAIGPFVQLYGITFALIAIYYAKKQLDDTRKFAYDQLEESRKASEQFVAQFGQHVRDSFSLSIANPRVRFLHDIMDEAKVSNHYFYRYISLYTKNLITSSLLELKPITKLHSLQSAIDKCFDTDTSVLIELGSGVYIPSSSYSANEMPYSSKLVFRFIETMYDCNGFDDPSYNSCEDAFSDLFLQMCKQHEGFDEIYTMGIENDKEEKEKVARKNAIVEQIIKNLGPNFDKTVRNLIRHNRYFPR